MHRIDLHTHTHGATGVVTHPCRIGLTKVRVRHVVSRDALLLVHVLDDVAGLLRAVVDRGRGRLRAASTPVVPDRTTERRADHGTDFFVAGVVTQSVTE